jgi:uncharacterized membrane protein YfcA
VAACRMWYDTVRRAATRPRCAARAIPSAPAAWCLPGVITGSVIRVQLLPGPRVFDLVVAAVLLPLGAWLALTRPAGPDDPGRPARLIPAPVLVVLAAVVGCVGGIYGLGGGAFLAPVLIGTGRRPAEAAPATLASTLVTSVAGVVTFVILSLHEPGAVSPDFDDGLALGIGGLADGYTGARLQSRMPDVLIRRLGRRAGHRHRSLFPVIRPALTAQQAALSRDRSHGIDNPVPDRAPSSGHPVCGTHVRGRFGTDNPRSGPHEVDGAARHI